MMKNEINNIQKSFENSFQNGFDRSNISKWKIMKRFRHWSSKYKLIKKKYHLDHYMAFLASFDSQDGFTSAKDIPLKE